MSVKKLWTKEVHVKCFLQLPGKEIVPHLPAVAVCFRQFWTSTRGWPLAKELFQQQVEILQKLENIPGAAGIQMWGGKVLEHVLNVVV